MGQRMGPHSLSVISFSISHNAETLNDSKHEYKLIHFMNYVCLARINAMVHEASGGPCAVLSCICLCHFTLLKTLNIFQSKEMQSIDLKYWCKASGYIYMNMYASLSFYIKRKKKKEGVGVSPFKMFSFYWGTSKIYFQMENKLRATQNLH